MCASVRLGARNFSTQYFFIGAQEEVEEFHIKFAHDYSAARGIFPQYIFNSASSLQGALVGTRKRVRKCKRYVGRRNIVSLFGMITKVVYGYVRKLPRSGPLR
jgi:hypothetical protein